MPVLYPMQHFGGYRKISDGNCVWLWAFSKTVMVQILWGRAKRFRLPVIPSPSCGGHGAVR